MLVDTRRSLVWPLFETAINVTRESVDQATINLILEDPEAETYQFVVKVVRTMGRTRSLAGRSGHRTDRPGPRRGGADRPPPPGVGRAGRGTTGPAEADDYRLQLEAVLNTKRFASSPRSERPTAGSTAGRIRDL